MEKKPEQPGVQNPAHVLRKKLQENRKSLHIARIPDKTKEAFIALAEEEFCGDYGMTLKWLIDDIPSQDTRMIIAKLEEQEARIQALESVTHTSEETPDEKQDKNVGWKQKSCKGVEEKMSKLNQIEEIEKLYAKPKTYKIPKEPKEGEQQINVKIMPLGLEDMGLMNVKDDASMKEISKNVISLWATSLRIDEDKARKISIEFMEDLMAALMDANNFKEEDIKKTGIKEFIKKKQEQTKEKENAKKESDRKA